MGLGEYREEVDSVNEEVVGSKAERMDIGEVKEKLIEIAVVKQEGDR